MAFSARIYVGTYGKYNAGNLHGAWIDLADHCDLDSFYEACKDLHSDENDPEFMFQDVECNLQGAISESHINPKIFEVLDMNEDQQLMLSLFTQVNTYELDFAIDNFEEAYAGSADTCADFAQELAELDGFDHDAMRMIVVDWQATWDCNYRHGYNEIRHEGEVYFFYANV